MSEPEQVRTKYVRVTNGLDVPWTDRHDGVPVQLEPGRSDNYPCDMAEHFFGYRDGATAESMFRHTAKRQGWNTPAHTKVGESGKMLAREMFDRLTIEPVYYRLVEERVDTEQPIPADPQIPDASEDVPAFLPRDKSPHKGNRPGAA
jgi:hypothetical protein